jgi:hypothetical protein
MILIACEFSGVVRRAFRALGYKAYSCDILPATIMEETEKAHHLQCNVLDVIYGGLRPKGCEGEPIELMVAHPPCTHLAVSGARWFPKKQQEQADALEFVRNLLNAPIPRIAVENPVSIISTRIRRPEQIIQPWQFGHGETKATCL